MALMAIISRVAFRWNLRQSVHALIGRLIKHVINKIRILRGDSLIFSNYLHSLRQLYSYNLWSGALSAPKIINYYYLLSPPQRARVRWEEQIHWAVVLLSQPFLAVILGQAIWLTLNTEQLKGVRTLKISTWWNTILELRADDKNAMLVFATKFERGILSRGR